METDCLKTTWPVSLNQPPIADCILRGFRVREWKNRQPHIHRKEITEIKCKISQIFLTMPTMKMRIATNIRSHKPELWKYRWYGNESFLPIGYSPMFLQWFSIPQFFDLFTSFYKCSLALRLYLLSYQLLSQRNDTSSFDINFLRVFVYVCVCQLMCLWNDDYFGHTQHQLVLKLFGDHSQQHVITPSKTDKSKKFSILGYSLSSSLCISCNWIWFQGNLLLLRRRIRVLGCITY